MITVPEAVEKIIKESTFLDYALTLGIINLSALARVIKSEVKKEVMKEVQEGAVIMALNRMAKSIPEHISQPSILFATSPDLMIRSNLIEMTFANSETLIPKRMRLLEQVQGQPNIFLTFTQGIFETTLIASMEIKETILAIFKQETHISQIENLSSLTVQLPKGTIDMPGAYHFILKPIAWAGINLKEVVSTLNEFTMILENKDIDQAFSLIKNLFNPLSYTPY